MVNIIRTGALGVAMTTFIGLTAAQALEWQVGNTTIKVYGYAKADFIYDLDADLGTTTFGLGSLAPGFASTNSSRAQAWQSRLGFETSTDTAAGPLMFRLEGDFFGGGGGTFRLRHAYGSLGGFLAGQTWTNFMPIESYPGTLDFQGPAGIPFARVNQFRYTFDASDSLQLSVSLEDDPAAVVDNRPAITAAASYSFGNSFVKAAAVSRSLADGLGGSENAYGFNLSGNSALWQGGMLYASLTTGEGIGSYMVFGGADLDAAGNAIQTSGVTIGVTQEITDNVSLALSYGYRDIDTGAATDTQKLSTIHVGINYSPVKNFTLGLEYFTGERTLFNATKASADRLQASAQFNF